MASLILVTCFSMTVVLHNSTPAHPEFWHAAGATMVLCAFIALFMSARFSFGYFAGIGFYGMIVGFFWASYFTLQQYDHVLARWSALASLLLFLLPALFQIRPLPRALMLTPLAMNRLMLVLLAFSAGVLALSATYGVALVGLAEAEQFRSAAPRPAVLNYILGWLIGAVLPFAFAYFAWHRRHGLAAAAIGLIWCSYPILLNKSVVFGGLWLPYLFVLFRLFEPKRATVVALLIPMLPGIGAYYLMQFGWISPEGTLGLALRFMYGNINIRMFGYPSLAMNYYSDFFAHHQITHFCQVGAIRAIYGCPYPFQLGATMAEAYHMGSMNGSLFATEGIASVGQMWAPLSALVCGLVVSLGNSASARLPAPVLAASAGFAVQQSLLNAPLSVSLLSNGLLVLWLLWAIAPPMEGGEG
ncbi:MAG: hypothetical protein JOZ74_05650 [Bradyrhizobium sp.]|nr:hypothetical protein [Bradyrhizobium sp.]